jgi:hypothetical protein
VTTTDQAAFLLDRFQWTAPGRLHVEGAWTAIERNRLMDPVLVVGTDDGDRRLEAVQDVATNVRRWSAVFPWEADAGEIRRAELQLGAGPVVELPLPTVDSSQRRHGRTRLAVRGVAHGGAPSPDGELITIHAAMLAAREEATAAKEELELAQAAAHRAREDGEHDRVRRQREAERLHDALETLRRLAEESLEKERGVAEQLRDERDEFEAALAAARAEAAERDRQIERLEAELADALGVAEQAQREADFVRERVAAVRSMLDADD